MIIVICLPAGVYRRRLGDLIIAQQGFQLLLRDAGLPQAQLVRVDFFHGQQTILIYGPVAGLGRDGFNVEQCMASIIIILGNHDLRAPFRTRGRHLLISKIHEHRNRVRT